MNDKPLSGIRTYLHHLKLFSKNARLFLVGAFFVGLAFAGFQLLFNLYMKELSYKESAIGQILSMNAWGAVIITLPVAYLLQKFQIRKVLILSTLLASMFYFLQATILELRGLLWVSLILGMMVASYRVAAAPFFMKNSTEKERTYLFSMNFGMTMFAAIIGSLGGGYLVSLFNNIFHDQVLGIQEFVIRGSLFWFIRSYPFLSD